MGGLQLKDSGSRIKLFDWGRGPVPIGWAMLIVGLLILSNSLGLILSQTFVIEGVPAEYRSLLEGEVQLPYIPTNGSGIEIKVPEEVQFGEPFNVSFTFQEYKIPHLDYDVVFINEGEESTFALFQVNNVLLAQVNFLNRTGEYQIHLRSRGKMITPVLHDQDWKVKVSANNLTHPVPILDGFSSPVEQDVVVFSTFELDAKKLTQFKIMINKERIISLSGLEGGKWGFQIQDLLNPGWNIVEIGKYNGSLESEILQISREFEFHQRYFINIGYDNLSDGWDLSGSVSRVLEGDDELFDQQMDDSIQDLDEDEIELYIDALYEISISINSAGSFQPGLPSISSIYLRTGLRTYPLILSENGEFKGYFFPPEPDDDGHFQIILVQGIEEIVIEEIDLVLMVDHAPHSHWSPDPFSLETYGNGLPTELELELFADWENFNRKDFVGKPQVDIDGSSKQPSKEDEEFLEHSYSFILNSSEAYSGNMMNISSTNSLEYANWLVLLVPLPNLFLVFPFPLTGWVAVAWFIMISIACIASVMLLFYRQIKPLWAGSKRTPFAKRMKKLYSPDSGLALTAKTYLGALFFFFAIYWMLDIFEQPTPGLSILSSETPIWIRMFLLADASVWEEISGRVVLIGIPLLIIRSISGKRGVQWKQLVGGTAHFGRTEVVLILISATLFGLAHLGWGPWKVIPTFVHGLMFGYLFVKVGLHASIVMHFLFDYTGFINEITGIYGPTWILVFFTTILLGGLFLGDWVYRCQNWSATSILKRAPKPFFQLFAHSLLSVALGIILILKGGPLSISSLFFSVPFVDAGFYVLWKTNRSRVWRIIILVWSHFAWAAAPFGIAWAVRPEEDGVDQGS
jgi:hypothetical protein